jgi:mono/diheme cytochrome c family protein
MKRWLGFAVVIGFWAAACGRGEAPKSSELPSSSKSTEPSSPSQPSELLLSRQTKPSSTPSIPTIDGKSLYVKNCAACHGENGKGDGPAAASLPTKPANLISPEVQKKSDEALEKVIHEGKPGTPMPPWGHLSKEEINALVKYIRKLGGKN